MMNLCGGKTTAPVTKVRPPALYCISSSSNGCAPVPFLPVREDFHPKRNQARQKLATLPQPRFKDLSSDVYYELGRRFPEFKELEVGITLKDCRPELIVVALSPQLSPPAIPPSPGSNYDDSTPPPTAQVPPFGQTRSPPRLDELSFDGSASTISNSALRRRGTNRSKGINQTLNQSDERHPRMPSKTPSPTLRYRLIHTPDDLARSQIDRLKGSAPQYLANPRLEQPLKGNVNARRRNLPWIGPYHSANDPTGIENHLSPSVPPWQQPHLWSPKLPLLYPINRQWREEDPIEVPFGRPDTPPVESGDEEVEEPESDLEASPPAQSEPALGGLAGLVGRFVPSSDRDRDRDREEKDISKSGDEYFDKLSFGRASVASNRSDGIPLSRNPSKSGRERDGGAAEREKEELKKEYEYKIATLQKRATSSEEKVRTMEEDLENTREVSC